MNQPIDVDASPMERVQGSSGLVLYGLFCAGEGKFSARQGVGSRAGETVVSDQSSGGGVFSGRGLRFGV